jgi:hypothetical protein
MATRAEGAGITDGGDERRRDDRPDTGDGHQALGRLIPLRLCLQLIVELGQTLLRVPQLIDQGEQHPARSAGNLLGICEATDQVTDIAGPLRGDDPELGQVSA